jgi:SAM-dependent methyltransferase
MTTRRLSTDATGIPREHAWHDRFADTSERSALLAKLTGPMTRDALRVAYDAAKERCLGARVLDYGSAEGDAALILRRYGASAVHGVDSSPIAVRHATDRVTAQGMSNVTFEVMNLEQLTVPDAHFDFVFGVGILQHLDVARAFAEVARVLTTHGSAVFLEPLAHNPVINAVRLLTPHARSRDAHPLTMADLRHARRRFNRVGTRFVNLTALIGAPLVGLRGAHLLHRTCSELDMHLVRLPWLARFAWSIVLTLEKPKLR